MSRRGLSVCKLKLRVTDVKKGPLLPLRIDLNE